VARDVTWDRHGSFIKRRGQWYFICNDCSRSGSIFYRDSSIYYVHYRANGEIEPVVLNGAGVAPVSALP
jgi:arabinoxylan arabinofuranohydrolase